MIRRISIEGFKSFKEVSFELGRFNLLIGPNASGKSNFLEALRVLQGFASGVPIKDIFDGTPKSASAAAWEPIRGGSSNAAYRQGGDRAFPPVDKIQLSVNLDLEAAENVSYSVTLFEPPHLLTREVLSIGPEIIFEIESTGQFALYRPAKGQQIQRLHLDALRSAISQLHRSPECLPHHLKVISGCVQVLSDMQHLDPRPEILRRYSEHGSVSRMGERGENFAALVNSIPDRESYERWLQVAVSEFGRVEIMKGALAEPLFALLQQNRMFAAPQLSDGTLRFAALAAAFFQPSMPKVLLMEEIETAIHPSRLHVLINLIKSQSARSETQVFATTHSPVVLAWLEEEDYRHVLLFQTDPGTGESHVLPVSGIPRFIELARTHSVAEMFAEGWMEAVL